MCRPNDSFSGEYTIAGGNFLSGDRARPLKLPLFVNIENISCIKAF
jgi:hypothetical protein